MRVWLCLVFVSVLSGCWQAHDTWIDPDASLDAGEDAHGPCNYYGPDGLGCWSPLPCEDVYYCGTGDCCEVTR